MNKSFSQTKQEEKKKKSDEKIASRARWLPIKRYWLLYIALIATGAMSTFAGAYLGLAPDESGYFKPFGWDIDTLTNILFAIYYAVGFLATAEGATLFWETKLVFHDVDTEGKPNMVQLWTARIALVVSIAAVIVTGLAAADFLAVWRGKLSAFSNIQTWAQGWVVWAIPVLFVFHAVSAILYWYNSEDARLERWKSQTRLQTQAQMSELEAQAWINEYQKIAPDLAKMKGAALARKAALEDFYAEEERLGVDLNGDGHIGRHKEPQVVAYAQKTVAPDFTEGQEKK